MPMLCLRSRRVNRDHGFNLRATGLPPWSSATTPDKGSDSQRPHVVAESRRIHREHDEFESEHQPELEAAEWKLRAAH